MGTLVMKDRIGYLGEEMGRSTLSMIEEEGQCQ